ncbi:hypothetical protein [Nocardioides ferulae]|uniref:hypothetical protein n=1 Tax=Nocardioides ferulae TaxID=2340821 RepID=UPI0013DE11E2|nr:hypothetical protein [Nocardioides ferulae]
MSVRRGPAIVLSLALSAAALAIAPTAQASDGGAAKDDTTTKECKESSVVRLRLTEESNGRLTAIATVWSDDSDMWAWKLKHEGDLSDDGVVKAKDADKSFKIVRSMFNVPGTDSATFRAENLSTGEVCRASAVY